MACRSAWTDRVIALGPRTDHVIALRSRRDCIIALRSVLQLCVTAQFYLENSRKIHPRGGVRECRPKDAKRRESPGPLAPLFICFFLPPGLPCVSWASQECCLFYLRSSFRSSDLPLFYFIGFSFLCFLATTILDSSPRDGRPNSLGIGASRSLWLLPAELGWRGVLGLPFC